MTCRLGLEQLNGYLGLLTEMRKIRKGECVGSGVKLGFGYFKLELSIRHLRVEIE